MAVKVRCPTCEKVLNAPDTARGKAIKCPGCETKVKVPAGEAPAGQASARKPGGKASGKAAARKKVDAPDSSEFLASLDLEDLADSSEAMCPKCGAALPEDATECPKCGVDPMTGQLTAGAKKRRNMKGPDPALFYKAAWTDSWAFTKENKKVAFRTAMYFLVYGAICGGCVYMVTSFCETLPPQVFWGVIAGACFLALPGWVWCLTIETIRVSAAKKSNIKGLHFDIFQNIALGVKTILWTVVFCWFPLAVFMQPLAMIHMAMPITIKGWMNFA
ncbi:MAG TPA: zinc ribbon domain-containing protein, partial [Planctomycetaceae bacterium]